MFQESITRSGQDTLTLELYHSFGLDPQETVTEANIEQLKSQHERKELEAIREERAVNHAPNTFIPSAQSIITFTAYDSVYDLIDDVSRERHIREISRLAWVMVGQNRYFLANAVRIP